MFDKGDNMTQNTVPALILATGLLGSALITAFALDRFGASVDRGCSTIGDAVRFLTNMPSFPSTLRIDLGDIKLQNADGSRPLKIETTGK